MIYAAYIIWALLVVIAMFAGGAAAWRQGGGRTVGWALLTVFGALMTWAFISTAVGVAEIDDYPGSIEFIISLIVGIAGLILFVIGMIALRRLGRFAMPPEE